MLRRILYIEDDVEHRKLMQALMADQPYIYLEATSGLSAANILLKHPIDLILLDVNLPDMNGLELVRIIRDSSIFVDVPIIAITADVMSGDERRCLDAGCDEYIEKPIMSIELFNKIRLILTSGHSRRRQSTAGSS